MLDAESFLTAGKYPDCSKFDTEYETEYIFDISRASRSINWDLVNDDNILAAVSGLAAGILEREISTIIPEPQITSGKELVVGGGIQ